ncbi:MAG TPA: LytTR family DNA-binding domain-containing protein [Steroidobacteraceae bacterium]|nr:LytTR family DNA-binding domain-containing protein [Steroidobacteraceae bacterium]
MTGSALRVLIVDDEALGRQRLEDLLRHEENVEIAGFADNGDAAVEAIRTLRPDLVFLDVQMPRRTGLEVVRDIGPENMPPTIFVTAYDRYALDAFDVAAVDYLVKPFDDERFEQAFRRARRTIGLTQIGRLSDQLRTVLNVGTGAAAAGSAASPAAEPAALSDSDTTGYLERIAVEMRGQVRVVPVATIEYIAASGPYAEIHVGERTYIIRERMQTLEERLDPGDFFRIHRSVIVKLDQIETLLREAGGDYAVQLRCGARLSVSRNRVEPLEKWMGLAKAR